MASFQKLIIYYFSGTGNSRNVAKWFSDVALKYNIETEIVNIAKVDRRKITPPPSDALVVFTSPIHGFNYPPVMLHFISNFPKGKNKVLLMNTRAGMLIGNFITPGLTGIAFYLSSLFLKIKGYSIVGMVPVDLPSNWLSLHPGLNERTVNYLQIKNKERVIKSSEKVLSGKNDFKALREIIPDIIVSPISIGYYFVGRFLFAKTFYASSDCNNCGLCIKTCPVKAIVMKDNRPYWTFNCESCMKCMSDCPKKAIETAHGFIIGYFFIFSAISTLFFKYFNSIFFVVENELIRSVIETLLFLFLLGVFYRLIHYLMRFTLVQKLMVYTSLTKYKFWGRRYKASKDI